MRKNILILGHNHATQFIDICNQYASVFPKEKYHVTIAYLSGEPNKFSEERTSAEEIIFLNFPLKKLRNLKLSAIKKLLALCREKNFEIVVCHRYKPIYVMLFVAQFLKIPTLFFVMHAMHTMKNISRKLLAACLFKKNMYFAGVSNAVRDDLRRNLWGISKERIITLYNCIDIYQTEKQLLNRLDARKALSLKEKDFVFGTMGRLAPEKDQKTLITAFAKIKPDCTNAKLLLIGDGKLAAELKHYVEELNLEDHIIFTGFIPNSFRYLKALDVFVLCSTKEAFGRVLLEAMIAKVPLIGTQTDGIPEVIQDAGFIVPASQAGTLALSLDYFYKLTPDDLLALGNKAYQRVNNYFSFEKFQESFFHYVS